MTKVYNLKKRYLLFAFFVIFSVHLSSAFPDVVRVVVTSRPLMVGNQDNGIGGLIRYSYVKHGKYKYNLWSKLRLNPKTATQLDLVLKDADGSVFRPELPESIKAGILSYFIHGPIGKDFDCMNYVQYLYGLEFDHGVSDFDQFMDQNWVQTLFDVNDVTVDQLLSPGQAIALATSRFESYAECCSCGSNNFFGKVFKGCAYFLNSLFPNCGWTYKHWAIYLGKGLYLSKGGINAPLIATDLESMKKIFEANSVVILKRKTSLQSDSNERH